MTKTQFDPELVEDMAGRLSSAIEQLEMLKRQSIHLDTTQRLSGKIEGVKLALDYLRSYQ